MTRINQHALRTNRVAARRFAALAGTACAAALLAGGLFGFAPQAKAAITTGVGVPELEIMQDIYNPRTVTVTGTASVSVNPDVADLSLAVRTQAVDAASCQDQAAQAVDAVKAALVELGVPEGNIVTSDVSLYPQYDYSQSVETIVGYQMYVSVTVQGLAVDEVGDVLATATSAGANVVNNVSYYCSDYDAQYQQALLLAIEQARGKAEAIAGATGAVLADPVSVTEGYQNTQYRVTNSLSYAVDEEVTDDSDSISTLASIDVDPGAIEISATVTVEYRVVSEELSNLIGELIISQGAYEEETSSSVEPIGEDAAVDGTEETAE